MGGNATKHLGTTRKSAEEYLDILNIVFSILKDLFPYSLAEVTKSYATKDSFGDIDILLVSDDLPKTWIEDIRAAFNPQEIIENQVISFDFMGIQVDIIPTPSPEFEIATVYFAFNDLGNLMGRIAHKQGFKYGHNGLWKVIREGTRVLDEVLVSDSPSEIFPFLGYDYQVFRRGFQTLEEVFQFASSTPLFHRDIFNLDNRNHVSRIRDMKRPTYNAFLKWIEDKPELDKYEWYQYVQDNPSKEKDREHEIWLKTAFLKWLEFKDNYYNSLTKERDRKLLKTKWNGNIVGEITGFKNKELGDFMSYCKLSFGFGFDAYIKAATPEKIVEYIHLKKVDFIANIT